MQIKINGELREIEATTLGFLVSIFKLDPDAVVIELNGHVAPKHSWETTPINAGDQIEIVAFVGGG